MSNITKIMRSNVIADGYLEDIKTRTIEEIFKGILHVYGPYAENIFVNATNAGAYHTRDGKVCLAHMAFDNSVARDIKNVFMQAVEHQSERAGDGTTTMTLFYAVIANELIKLQKTKNFPIVRFRKLVTECINSISIGLKSEFVESVTRDSDEIKRTIYTTVQDTELAEIIFKAVSQSQEHTILDVMASDEIEGTVIEVNDEPRFEGSVIYATESMPKDGNLDKCAILYVDGKVEFNHLETIEILTRTPFVSGDLPFIKNIIILCEDITDTTRKTLKEFSKHGIKGINNLVFFRIKGHREFKNEYKNDVTAVVYDKAGLSGLEQPLTFEAHIIKCLTSPKMYEELCGNLQLADENVQYMANVFRTLGIDCNISELSGLKIDKDATSVTKEMLKHLKEQVEATSSPFTKAEIRERIRKIYGNYIVLKIGSKMLKDRQRESELVLDAFISSQRAIEGGIMKTNGMMALLTCARELEVLELNPLKREFYKVVVNSAIWVIMAIVYKAYGIPMSINIDGDVIDRFLMADYPKFGRMNIHELTSFESIDKVDDFNALMAELYQETMKVTIDGIELSESPIEPADTILSIVENLTMPFDLAYAKAFIAHEFMENYI